jgi:hypothetical protein
MEKEIKIIGWNRIFCTSQNGTAVKRVEFVSDRVLYIVLRGQYNMFVLNVHAPREEKSFYEELEQVLIIFLSTI